MITDDFKSGVSVPETFKQTSTKTQNTFISQVIDPGTQEVALSTPSKSLSQSVFEVLVDLYARSDMTLRRTDSRDGPVTYFVIADKQIYEERSLSFLFRVYWAWEKQHG